MSMRLQMLQKPPVVFAQYNPAKVISPSELAAALRSQREDAIIWLWLSYSRTVLDDVDPCMEANEGAAATIALASRYPGLSHMAVRRVRSNTYELRLAGAGLSVQYNIGEDDVVSLDLTQILTAHLKVPLSRLQEKLKDSDSLMGMMNVVPGKESHTGDNGFITIY